MPEPRYSTQEQVFMAIPTRELWDQTWMMSAPKDRPFQEYSDSLGIDFAMFAGQRVLDVGAGLTSRFAREAADHGVDIYSVNPGWGTEEYLKITKTKRKEVFKHSVAATGQELPFGDNSFDFIVSFWGVPSYLPGTAEAYTETFTSLRRVLAPNGWGILAPIPRSIIKVPKFHEILESTFPQSHEFVSTDMVPKLLLYKDLTSQKVEEINRLKPSIDAAQFPIW